MPSLKYDLAYLRVGITQLEKYLQSKELYYPIGEKPPPGEPPFPRLTPGGLLLTQTRLNARELEDAFIDNYSTLEEQMNVVKKEWRVAWEKKVIRDFNARINLWRNFLEDHRKNPPGHYDRYAYEVRSRVVMNLLSNEGANISSEKLDMLFGLDRFLRAVFIPGDFIWEQELSQGFPAQPYWYLYGSISKV
jgi:hypothetical protein